MKNTLIVVPGGGFAYKSMKEEGVHIAEFLNRQGISAFVLWYRINPYRMPVPYLDCQRAVRYVKYHAAEYGLDAGKVGTIGFSAGAFCCGAQAIGLCKNQEAPTGYVEDEIDKVDDRPLFTALIYPVVQLYEQPNMLRCLTGVNISDPNRRKEAGEAIDLARHVDAHTPPQFVCYGTKVPLSGMADYCRKLRQVGAVSREVVLEGIGHGFGLCDRGAYKKYAYWTRELLNWADRIVKGE